MTGASGTVNYTIANKYSELMFVFVPEIVDLKAHCLGSKCADPAAVGLANDSSVCLCTDRTDRLQSGSDYCLLPLLPPSLNSICRMPGAVPVVGQFPRQQYVREESTAPGGYSYFSQDF